MVHTYVLMTKPTALTLAEWRTVLKALAGILISDDDTPGAGVLGKAENDPQPSRRLHYRLSLDRTQIILHGTFDPADLSATDLTRLCKVHQRGARWQVHADAG